MFKLHISWLPNENLNNREMESQDQQTVTGKILTTFGISESLAIQVNEL